MNTVKLCVLDFFFKILNENFFEADICLRIVKFNYEKFSKFFTGSVQVSEEITQRSMSINSSI